MPFRELFLRSRVVDPFDELGANSTTVFGDADDCRSKPIFVAELRNQCYLHMSDKHLRRPIFHTAGYLFDIWQGIAHG